MYAINTLKLSSGIIGVESTEPLPDKIIKVETHKAGHQEYRYNLHKVSGNFYPLTCGGGEYKIKVHRQVEGQLYKMIQEESVLCYMPDPHAVFLQSNVNMPWADDMECVIFASNLTKDMASDAEKVKTIWDYMISNYHYDTEFAERIKANNGKYNYIPWLNKIWRDKKDICFGLTSLYNSMLRAVGVKCQMLHGEIANGYHCWSAIWQCNKWIYSDVTYGIAYHKMNKTYVPDMLRDKYTVKYIY